MCRAMDMREKCDLVLDAFNVGAVTKTELEWLMPMVMEQGDKLTKERIVELIVGDEADQS